MLKKLVKNYLEVHMLLYLQPKLQMEDFGVKYHLVIINGSVLIAEIL